MYKKMIAGLLVASFAGPAMAAKITDAAKCKSEVEIVKQLDADSDVGPKFEPIAKDLIVVLEQLCEKKDYQTADSVASSIRGMFATE